MSDNNISQRNGRAFFLKNGQFRDDFGLNNFHPASNVNRLDLYLEDATENSIVLVNFKAERKGLYALQWFPTVFSGFENHKLSGEQGFRHFSRFWTLVPPQVTQWNANGHSPLKVDATVVQYTGDSLLGVFDSEVELNATYPANVHLYNDNNVAYVYDDSESELNPVMGFYMVENDDGYKWVLIDDPKLQLSRIQVKAYNVLSLTIQKGNLPAPDRLMSITEQATHFVLNALQDIQSRIIGIDGIIGKDGDISKATVKGFINVLDNKVKNIEDVELPKKVNKSGDTMEGPLDMGKNKLKGINSIEVDDNFLAVGTEHGDFLLIEEDEIKFLEGKGKISGLKDAENDNQAVTKRQLDKKADTTYVNTELGKKVKKSGDTMTGDLDMNGNDITNVRELYVKQLQRHDNSPIEVLSDIDLDGYNLLNTSNLYDKNYIDNNLIDDLREASTTLRGVMTASDKAKLENIWAVFQGKDEDSFVNTIQEILYIFSQYPEGLDIIEKFSQKVDKTTTINQKPLSDNITLYGKDITIDNPYCEYIDKQDVDEIFVKLVNEFRRIDGRTLYNQEHLTAEVYENMPIYDDDVLYFVYKEDDKGKMQIYLYIGDTLVSGGGGEGGGGIIPQIRFVPEPLTQPITFNSVVGEEASYTVKYEHEESATATFRIYRNDLLVSTRTLSVGTHTINLKPYIYNGTNTIRLEVEDFLEQKRRIILNVTGVEINVSSTYQETTINDGEILFPYKVDLVGQNSKVYFKIDDNEPIVDNVTTANNIKALTLDNCAYVLEFWATTEIGDLTLTSNKLRFMILVDDGTYVGTILASKFNIESIEYGERLTIDYIAYNRTKEKIDVEGFVDETKRIEVEVTSGKVNSWNIGVLEEGLHEIQLVADANDLTYSVSVLPSAIDISTVDDIRLKTYLTSLGKDNSAIDRDEWKNSGINGQTYPFIMSNFNYSSNGWLDDALVFNGKAKAELQYKPFEFEVDINGRTIEIEFETPQVHDGSNLIECVSDGIGFEIKGNKASLIGSNVRADAYYSENTKVKVSFVISKAKSKMFLYLNGLLTNQGDLVSNTRFEQDTASYIKLNENLQGLKVYNIRVYERELEATEVLENYIYDIPNINDKFEEYYKTLIYDGGKVSLEKVKQIIPVMTISLTGDLPQDPNYRPNTTEIRYENMFNENLNFRLNNVRIRTQGTSTLVYPVKNYRLYEGDLTTTPITLVEGSRPAHILNLKTDYVDSSVATNSVLARLFENMYEKGTRVMADYPELEARTTIYGSPVAVFHNNNGNVSFVGLYSLNNDKSEPAIYGHGIAPYEYSHRFEITQNLGDSAGAFVKKDGITEQEWWAELKADYESIYPKEVVTNANYQELREMVEFISDFDLDNIGSMSEPDIDDYKEEFEERFDLEYITKYFIVASMFGLLDSFGKNLQLNTWRDESDEGFSKWFLTFYDLDTAIGLDNEGRLLDANGNYIYDYNIELEKGEGFAQADSKLWKVFVALYDDYIEEIYQELRANYFTDNKIYGSFFDDHIDLIGKAIYNDSNFFKYILTSGSQAWNYMLNGNRKLQIKSWVSNRLKFLDSKYIAGTNTTDKMVAFRMSFEAGDYPELEITPHFHQYATVQFGNPQVEGNIVSERTDAYEPVFVKFKRNVGAEFLECRVYGADNIAEIDGFTDFDVDSVDFQYATNILKIDLSKDTPYDKLENLNFGNNTLLKNLNLENLVGVSGNLDFKGLINLEKLNIKGTQLQNIELPNGGAIEELHLNDTLTSLSLQNLTYLETITLESGDNIKELTIENTPVDLIDLIDGMPNLTHLRVREYNYSSNDKNFVLDLINAIYDDVSEEYKYGTIKSDGTLSTNISDLRQMIIGEIRLQISESFTQNELDLINTVLPNVEVIVTNLTLSEDFDLIDVGEYYEIEKYNGSDANVVLPAGYNSLLDVEYSYSFYGFEGWKLVEGVGNEAFRENVFIRTIDFGNNIKYIGDNAFRETFLTFNELPKTINKIGEFAFYGLQIDELYLDVALKEVGANAFYGNKNATIYVGHKTRPELWAENWTNSINVMWNKLLFVRTFMVDGIEIFKGYILKTLPILTKDGYTFDKFTYNDVEVVLPFVPTNEMPSVINIVSHWNLIPYTITYNGIDANVDNSDNPTTFTIEDLPFNLERPLGEPSGQEGEIWDGWFTASSGGTQVAEITTIGNKVVYGRWSPLSFKNATPLQLLDFVNQGLASALPVGETQTITLLDDNETQVELRLVDNTGNIIRRENNTFAGLVIEFRHIYKEEQMTPTNTNAGGWDESVMRLTTMDEIWSYMPLEWKAVISKAQVQTMNGGNQANVELTTSLDYLWLPAEREIFGTNTYSHEDEWEALTRFKYYEDNDSDSTSRIKQFDGSNKNWWLRSADSNRNYYFVIVSSGGRVNLSGASSNGGVSPCFII